MHPPLTLHRHPMCADVCISLLLCFYVIHLMVKKMERKSSWSPTIDTIYFVISIVSNKVNANNCSLADLYSAIDHWTVPKMPCWSSNFKVLRRMYWTESKARPVFQAGSKFWLLINSSFGVLHPFIIFVIWCKFYFALLA